MAYPYVPPLQNKFIVVSIPDISTADEVYFTPGFAGKIRRIYSCIDGTIATGDADLTCKIGTTAVTGGLITVTASGSASGDIDSVFPTALNSFSATDFIEMETDGASTNTVKVTVTFELEPA